MVFKTTKEIERDAILEGVSNAQSKNLFSSPVAIDDEGVG